MRALSAGGRATKVPLRRRGRRRTLGAMAPRILRRARLPLALVIAVALAAPASALGARIARPADCSGPSRGVLTVRRVDGGMLRVRLAIAGGPEGHKWNVFMDHNGEGFYSGTRIAREGGLVVVRRRTEDLDGADRIRAGAHDTESGETCTARAMLP